MNCSEIRELMPLMVDDMLEQEQKEMVENHLLTCDACKQELESHLLIAGLLKELADVPLPEEFEATLRKKLQSLKPPAKKRNWIRYSTLAAIFLVGIFSIALYNDTNTAPVPPTEEFGMAATTMMTADQEAENPTQRMLKMAEPEVDEELNQYLELLEEMYKGKTYQVIGWTKESPQIYRINIEVETIMGTEAISKEAITYKGQDGVLCRTE